VPKDAGLISDIGDEGVWISEPVPAGQSEELPPARRQFDEESTFADGKRAPGEEPRDRFRSFEELLRRNRVDITASCRSCRAERERAA